MTIRISDGLRASLLGEYGLSAMMNYGIITVRSGIQPASASFAPTGTLLARITQNGDAFVPDSITGGLQVILADSGALTLNGLWRMKGVATGDAGWWRWQWNSTDDEEDSLYYPRMDGAVGESLVLAADAITGATNVAITDFNVNFLE